MNYDHEKMNHGCQGDAEYFYTLIHALKIACDDVPSADLRGKAYEAKTRVICDLLDTLDGFRIKPVWTATVSSKVNRTVKVEADDEYEAKRKVESMMERSDDIIESIGKSE